MRCDSPGCEWGKTAQRASGKGRPTGGELLPLQAPLSVVAKHDMACKGLAQPVRRPRLPLVRFTGSPSCNHGSKQRNGNTPSQDRWAADRLSSQ